MQYSRMIRPHIIAIRKAEVVVKAVLFGQELLVMSQMPFPVAGGRISLLLADLGERDFV